MINIKLKLLAYCFMKDETVLLLYLLKYINSTNRAKPNNHNFITMDIVKRIKTLYKMEDLIAISWIV
jgi:hypothetical protein